MPYTLIYSSQRIGKDKQEIITDFEKMSREKKNRGKALRRTVTLLPHFLQLHCHYVGKNTHFLIDRIKTYFLVQKSEVVEHFSSHRTISDDDVIWWNIYGAKNLKVSEIRLDGQSLIAA